MSSPLCSAVARCHARRLRGIAARAPLAVVAVAALVVATPFACLRLGDALGRELDGSLGAQPVSVAVVAGPAVAAAVAGMASAVSLRGRAALGVQLAAAPFPSHEAVVAVCLVPAAGGVVLLLPSLLAFAIPFALALGDDGAAGVALALGILAAVPGGAVLAEGALAAARGARRRAVLVVAAAAAWALLGWSLGAAVLGPLAAVANALRDNGSSWSACAASFASLLVLTCCWVALAARRPDARPRSQEAPARIVRARTGVVALALVALLVRRADVRLTAVGAVAFGIGGVVLAVVAEAPAPAAFMLGTTTALLGAVVASLAVCGVVREGGWLWLSAPAPRAAIARAAWAVALLLTSAPVLVVGCAAVAVSPTSWGAVGTIAVVVWLAADAAMVAGVIVPWGAGAGEQVSTFAAFGAVAIAGSLAVGVVAPRVVAIGVPDAATAAVLCCGGAGGAALALLRGLEAAKS